MSMRSDNTPASAPTDLNAMQTLIYIINYLDLLLKV